MSGLELHVKSVAAGRTTVDVVTDSNGRLATTSFVVTVTATTRPGDLNMDGLVDVADVTKLIQAVLGSVLCDFDPAAGDLNHDGILDVDDVVKLIHMVLTNENND